MRDVRLITVVQQPCKHGHWTKSECNYFDYYGSWEPRADDWPPSTSIDISTVVNCAMPNLPSGGGNGGGGGGSTTPNPPGTYNPCDGNPQPVGPGGISFERGTRLMLGAPTDCDEIPGPPVIITTQTPQQYLMDHLDLDAAELSFVNNPLNGVAVTELTKYLINNGTSVDNTNFVHWALGHWTIKPNITLAQLDNIYDAIRYQTYVPRDREPASYYWRPLLSNSDGSDNFSILLETTPHYTYPNGQKTINLEAFNCHYYAFGLTYASQVDHENPKWVIAIKIETKDWEQVTGAVRVGDRVMYSLNNNGTSGWTHSAIVTEVDADGYATKVSSKMGTYQIIEHHPRDIPVSYGTTAPTFTIEGKQYPSRVYWRKK